METILRTENLCKYYGSGENEVRAVQNVNIEITKGEFAALNCQDICYNSRNTLLPFDPDF